MSVNRMILKIRGKEDRDQPYELGEEILCRVVVTDIQKKDMEDGSWDEYYLAKLFLVEEK